MPDSCFCESVRSIGIMQPANTWSSLAFVVVGLLILSHWARDRREPGALPPNRFNTRPVYPLLFAFAAMVIGFGSAFFHARLTFVGQFVDVLGMYFIATFALVYGIDRIQDLRAGAVVASYVGLNALLASLLWWVPIARRIFFGALIAAVLAVEVAGQRVAGKLQSARFLWMAAGVFAIAFAIWTVDYTRVACSPESLIQGHAIWHILGALSAWLLYRYYREAAVSG